MNDVDLPSSDLPPARILDVSPDDYHKLAGFSASLATIAELESIAHARDAYERRMERATAADSAVDDGDDVSGDKQKRMDLGSIMHSLLLGAGKSIAVIPTAALAKNGAYGTKESKDLRDGARARGLIPIKEHDLPALRRHADYIRARILDAGHRFDGRSELAIEWDERTPHGPVQCRAMLDHVVAWSWLEGEDATPTVVDIMDPAARAAVIYDLKIGVANPKRIIRSAADTHAIQPAAYTRALSALVPRLAGRIEFRFLFCEPVRPFAVWDPTLSGPFREIGERRWLRHVRAWGEGLATGNWPAYRTPANAELTASIWTLKQEGFTPEEF